MSFEAGATQQSAGLIGWSLSSLTGRRSCEVLQGPRRGALRCRANSLHFTSLVTVQLPMA
eukprot:2230035-Pyramimonas_sp.AAC.1